MRFIQMIFFTITLAIAASGQGIKYTTEAKLKGQIAAVPCVDNKGRLDAVKALFLKLGATEDDVRIEKLKDVENVVVTKRGKTAETIIVGAHYDRRATAAVL